MADFPTTAARRAYLDLTGRLDAEGQPMPEGGLPKRLTGCDLLLADAVDEEVIPFRKFVLLAAEEPPPSTGGRPGRRPSRPARSDDLPVATLNPWAGIGSSPKKADRLGKSLSDLKQQVDQLHLAVGVTKEEAATPRQRRLARQTGRSLLRTKGRSKIAPDFTRLVSIARPDPATDPTVRSIVNLAPLVRVAAGSFLQLQSLPRSSALTTGSAGKPIWAVGVEYEQVWRSLGYRRGRLVRSLPLTPGEEVEVTIKTWDKRTTRRTLVDSIEQNLSTELTGEEKWTLATAMTSVNTTGMGVNANAGASAGVSVPVEVVSVNVGGELGIAGEISSSLTNTVQHSNDFIQSATLKSANALKTQRTNTVETTAETGEETATTQKIRNENKCHTLTYHYFEILEDFVVSTAPVSADLFLLLPLPVPTEQELGDPKWILANECALRTVLPCEEYYAGFDGARERLIAEEIATAGLDAAGLGGAVGGGGSGAGGSGGAGGTNHGAALDNAVNAVLDAYRLLASAELLATGEGLAGAAEEALDNLVEWGSGVLEKAGQAAAQGAEDVAEFAEDAVGVFGQALEDTGEAIGDFISGFPLPGPNALAPGPLARMPQLGVQALGLGTPEPGPGAFLYWQGVEIISPNLADALLELELAWSQLPPEGSPERAQVQVRVVSSFFGKVGDPRQAIGAVDNAFAAAAAGAIIVNAAGATLVAVLAAIEGLGLADTVPDDLGLGEAIRQLEAQFRSSMSAGLGAFSSTGIGAGAGDEAISVIDRRIEARRIEIRELAEARVEFGRLSDHLQANIDRYAAVFWNQLTAHEIGQLIVDAGIPPEVVEHDIDSFVGTSGALRVTDRAWVERQGGPSWEKVQDRITSAKTPDDLLASLPTQGMTVEPAMGQCDACDAFIRTHRELDIENRRAEVGLNQARALQEALEAQRFQARIDAEELSDPTPFEGAEVTVETSG